jgi:hypothetical protein
LLWLGLPAAADVPDDSTPRASGLIDRERVTRVRWPVRLTPRRPGGCDDLGPADLEVREGGRAAEVDGVESRRPEMLHAIVVDASLSMETRMARMRAAARRYVDGLPAGHRVMVASFADNLELAVPPTRDRAALLRAIDGLGVRFGTALDDGLYYTLRYLEREPGRKILLLLTDGCDRTSLGVAWGARLERYAAASGVTIFPVGIDVPRRCDPDGAGAPPGGGPLAALQRLARASGGRLFRSSDAAGLGDVARTIGDLLAREGTVIYRPPADSAGGAVRVRARTNAVCRIESAGPRRRETSGDEAPIGEPALGETRQVEDWWPRSAQPARWTPAPGEIRGRTSDVVTERSLLYDAPAYWGERRYRPSPDRRPRVARRDVRVQVPSFARLRRTDSPQELLWRLLERDPGAFVEPAGADRPRASVPREPTVGWIHGTTFLEVREALGLALYAYPEYRAFMQERLRAEYHAAMLATLDDWRLLPAQRAALREAILGSDPQPRPADPQRYLAEWLGDIPAHELVRNLERTLVNELLAGERREERLALVDRRWRELPRWFPPPTRTRMVVPLQPVYDAGRDRVGFYRIVLPRVDPTGPPADAIPPQPLALTFVRHWLARHPEVAGGDFRIDAPRYRGPKKRYRRKLVREMKREGLLDVRRLSSQVPLVGLSLRDGKATHRLTVAFDGGEPRCLDRLGDAPLPAVVSGLLPDCRRPR